MNREKLTKDESPTLIPAGTLIPKDAPRSVHEQIYRDGGFTQPDRDGVRVFYPEDREAVMQARADLVQRPEPKTDS